MAIFKKQEGKKEEAILKLKCELTSLNLLIREQ